MKKTIIWFIIVIGMVLLSQVDPAYPGEYVHPPISFSNRMAAPDHLGFDYSRGSLYVRNMKGQPVVTINLFSGVLIVNGEFIGINGYYEHNLEGPGVPLNTDGMKSVVIGLDQ
jgi:hypothetical protein